MPTPSSRDCLAARNAPLADALRSARRLLGVDPPAALVRLRLALELLVRDLVADADLDADDADGLHELIDWVGHEYGVDRQSISAMHEVRIAGNRAAHDGVGVMTEARSGLRTLSRLAERLLGIQRADGDTETIDLVEEPGRCETAASATASSAPNEELTRPQPDQAERIGGGGDKEGLLQAAGRARQALAESPLNADALDRAVESARSRVKRANEPFRLAVVGEFRVGKSTLVNALAGDDLLLTDVVEATPCACVIRPGKSRAAAVIHVDGGRTEGSPEQIAQMLSDRRVDTDWLEGVDFVEVTTNSGALGEVEIWDSPGLGGSEMNEERANLFLERVGGAVWVLDITQLGQASVVPAVHRLRSAGKRVVVALNRVDSVDPGDVPLAVEFVNDTFGEMVEDVVAVSALGAREAQQLSVPTPDLDELRRSVTENVVAHAEDDREERRRAAMASSAVDCAAVIEQEAGEVRDRLDLLDHLASMLNNSRDAVVAKIPGWIDECVRGAFGDAEREAREALLSSDATTARVEEVLSTLDAERNSAAAWSEVSSAVLDRAAELWSRHSEVALDLSHIATSTEPCQRLDVVEWKAPSEGVSIPEISEAGDREALRVGAASAAALGVFALASSTVTWPLMLAAVPLGLMAKWRRESMERSLQPGVMSLGLDAVADVVERKREALRADLRQHLPSRFSVAFEGERERIARTIAGPPLEGLTTAEWRQLLGTLDATSARLDRISELNGGRPGAGVLERLARGETLADDEAREALGRTLERAQGRVDLVLEELPTDFSPYLPRLRPGVRVRCLVACPMVPEEPWEAQIDEALDGWEGDFVPRRISREALDRSSLGHAVFTRNAAFLIAGNPRANSAFSLSRHPLGRLAVERQFVELWTGRAVAASRGRDAES